MTAEDDCNGIFLESKFGAPHAISVETLPEFVGTSRIEHFSPRKKGFNTVMQQVNLLVI